MRWIALCDPSQRDATVRERVCSPRHLYKLYHSFIQNEIWSKNSTLSVKFFRRLQKWSFFIWLSAESRRLNAYLIFNLCLALLLPRRRHSAIFPGRIPKFRLFFVCNLFRYISYLGNLWIPAFAGMTACFGLARIFSHTHCNCGGKFPFPNHHMSCYYEETSINLKEFIFEKKVKDDDA